MPIVPVNTSTKTISATDTSSSTALATSKASNLRVVNAGSDTVFVRVGNGAQTAVLTDLPILANGEVIISVTENDTHIGAICASTETATVFVSHVYIAAGY